MSNINVQVEEVADVRKALSEMQGNSFQLEDVTEIVQRTYVKPRLLTALLGGMTNERFLKTDVFKYDETAETPALPAGKAYSAHGPDIQKDRPKVKYFEVPSFGVRMNVAPGDYAGRRRPGSTEFLTEADVINAMSKKAEDGWSMLDELGMAQLLAADTNILRGGPFETYNFYTDIVGSSRAAAINMDLGTATTDHIQLFRNQKNLLKQELQKAGDSASMFVCICSDTFFNKRYEIEKQATFQRELRGSLDLMSMAIPESDFGSATFQYENFMSHDGILYINYGAEIISGSNLITDGEARLVPVGANKLIRMAYAPAHTRQYVNRDALSMYGWTTVDDRQGVTMLQESNKLFSLINPRAIIHLGSST